MPIRLRAIEAGDLPLIQSWRNSDKVMPYCRQYRPLSLADMGKWYERLVKDNEYNLTNDLFIIEHNLKSVGVGGLVRIDWRNSKGELSFYLAEFDEIIANKAISVILEYAFKTLGLFKVYFPIFSFNPYLKVYEKIMKREYVAKREYYHNGEFHDRIILVKFNDRLIQDKCSI